MLDVIFLDFETTGLEPDQDAILEMFAQRVTVGAEGAVTRHPSVHWMGAAAYELAELHPRVQAMHTDSGLLTALAALPRRARRDLDSELERVLTAFIPDGAMLAGRSIHFDRGFIQAQLPLVAAKLHHRMLDVTGLVTLAEAVGIVPPPGAIAAPNHRAEGDVDHAIGCLRYLAPFLFLGGQVWREWRALREADGATDNTPATCADAFKATAPIGCYPPPAELASTIPPPAPLPREVPEGRKTDPIPPAIVPCPPTLRDVGARTSRLQSAAPNYGTAEERQRAIDQARASAPAGLRLVPPPGE